MRTVTVSWLSMKSSSCKRVSSKLPRSASRSDSRKSSHEHYTSRDTYQPCISEGGKELIKPYGPLSQSEFNELLNMLLTIFDLSEIAEFAAQQIFVSTSRINTRAWSSSNLTR